jgi:hypothetical protein
MSNRAETKRLKACCPGDERPRPVESRYPLAGARSGDGLASGPALLTRGDLSASAAVRR